MVCNEDIFDGVSGFVETRFGNIYYEIEGKGPPVYLLSGGSGAGHSHYHPWFSALADRYTVVYFDNIGTGASVRLADRREYTLANYSEVIEAVRRALGHKKIALVGLSFGSLPGLQYCMDHTDNVAAFVSSNGHLSALSWQAGNIDNMNDNVRLMFPEQWQEILRYRRDGVLSGDQRVQDIYGSLLADLYWVDPWGHPRLHASSVPENDENYDVYFGFVGEDPEWEVGGTLKGFDPTARLKGLNIPVLVVTGRYDRITPVAIAFDIANAFPTRMAQIKVFERSAHRPWIEESEAYFNCVKAFLADAWTGK